MAQFGVGENTTGAGYCFAGPFWGLRAVSRGQIDVIYGRYQSKPKKEPLVSDLTTIVEVLVTEEKGSDVNLAVDIVRAVAEQHQ